MTPESESIELLKALAVETRVKIIELLKRQGPMGVKELAKLLGISAPAVSQHLKVLRQTGLVRRERQGYWLPYSINEETLDRCGHKLLEICTCGCEGAGTWRERELQGADLKELRNYEEELLQELERVRREIQEKKPK
jgi:DNA-binding transcriptional ArsR family regulator